MLSATRVVLVVNPKVLDVRDLQQFTDHVRKNPGMHYTTVGHGGLGHFGLELWAQQSGLKVSHVSYRGTAPALEDVLGGRVPAMVLDAKTALPYVQSGALRPVVTVSAHRSPAFPDLPTATELGVSSLQIDGTIGIVAPSKTPAAIVDLLRTAVRRGTEGERFAGSANATGAVRLYMDAPEYGAWLQRESDRLGRVIKDAGLDQAPAS
jgi:tripartite-type tricarboxylate transporter receptor subunit TctC